MCAIENPTVPITADQLADVHQSTLLVWGRDDPFGDPDVGERMVEALPEAEGMVVEGGHAPWLARSARIGPRVNRFLSRYG